MQLGDYVMSNPEGSVMSDNISNNILSNQLGYPQTSNEAAQNFRFRSSHGMLGKENICPNVDLQWKDTTVELNTLKNNPVRKRLAYSPAALNDQQIQPTASNTLPDAELHHQTVQTQLLQNLENMVVESKMPSLEVQKFDGTPAKYTAFIRSFDDLIGSKTNNPTRLLAHLIKCCVGEALEKVEGLTLLEPSEGYKEARAILKLHYGQPHIIARSMLDELLNSDAIERDRSVPLGKKLLNLSSRIQTVYNTMKAINSFADVNSYATISQLVVNFCS